MTNPTSRLLTAACLVAAQGIAIAAPADTYFSLAVTENSHNHRGQNLLFLDFQDQLDTDVIDSRTVISPRIESGRLQVDGQAADWPRDQLTTIDGLPVNNYPLSQAYDTVAGPITVGSAHDDRYIYFLVQFEDANHDASTDRNRWVFDGRAWDKMRHVTPRAGAPTSLAVNAAEVLSGRESEDRVFFMFPIVDQQDVFRDGSFGCAAYCHSNLIDTAAPAEAPIGAKVARMHTSVAGDLADIWHWTSTRSAPMRTLKDAHLVFGEGSFNGRKADSGDAPEYDNDRLALKMGEEPGPAFVSRADYEAGHYRRPGFATRLIMHEDRLALTADMQIAEGVTLPFSIHQPSTGSRADVTVAANYDADTHFWTVEFRRALRTGDGNDRQFEPGEDARPPRTPPTVVGNRERGRRLFIDKACASCHGANGEGVFENGRWVYPRNQRASGALIWKTASLHRQKRLRHLAGDGGNDQALMPFVPLSRQEAEDIAAWLQTRFTPRGR